ncbi:MAG: YCF48-related protein, partial [Calditrichia bacterium]
MHLRQRLTAITLLILIPVTFAAGQSGWEVLSSGTQQNLQAVQFLNADSGRATGQGGTILQTSDGGQSWNILPFPFSVDLSALHFFTGDTGLSGGDGGIYRTTDGGQNWSAVSTGIPDAIRCLSFAGDYGIAGAASQSLIYSADRGQNWQVAQSGFFGGGVNGAVMLSSQIGFVGGQNSIFQPLAGKTTDGGANWSFTPFYLQNNEGAVLDIEFTDENIGYAACRVWDGRGAIARTADGGQNWTSSFFNAPLQAMDFPVSNAGMVGYAAGDGGAIYKTTDAGINWILQNSGTTEQITGLHFLDPDTGYAVGANGLILKTVSGGEPPIGIGEYLPGNSLPTDFVLYQN